MKKIAKALNSTSIKIGVFAVSLFLVQSCQKEENVIEELKKMGYVETSKELKKGNLEVNSIQDFLKVKAQNPINMNKGNIFEMSIKNDNLKLKPNQQAADGEGQNKDPFSCFFSFYGITTTSNGGGSPSSILNHYFNAFGSGNTFTGASMNVTGTWAYWYGVNLWSTSPGTYNNNPSITLYFNTFYNINAAGSSSGILQESHEVRIWRVQSTGTCYLQVIH